MTSTENGVSMNIYLKCHSEIFSGLLAKSLCVGISDFESETFSTKLQELTERTI